jgi:S-DNA-T family DNA segregation ATPase FtsK/SpoIIIE
MIINLNKLRQSFTSTIQNKIKESTLLSKTFSLQETRTFTLSNPSSVKSFLARRQEGIFGFEYYNSLGTIKNHFFTTDQSHISLPSTTPVILDHTREDIECYYMTFRNHSFAPFIFNYQHNFWETLTKYLKGSTEKGSVYLQLIFSPFQSDKWKDELCDMYDAYLDGINQPSTNQMLLKWQYKLHDVLKGRRNAPIREVSQKVDQYGYSTCVRLIIQGSEGDRRRIKERIKLALSNLNYVNGLNFALVKNHQQFLENMQIRNFNKKYSHQIMCSSEMIGFFGGMSENESEEMKQVLMPKPKIPIEEIMNDIEILPSVNQQSFNEDDKELIDELTAAMLRLNLLKNAKDMTVLEVKEGPTLKFIEFLRPDYLYLQNANRRLADLRIEMNEPNLNLTGGNNKGTFCISYPRLKREYIDLAKILESIEFKRKCDEYELPICVGTDMNGEYKFYDFVDLVHMLIAGATGNGKSVFVTALLLMLTEARSPEELELHLIDMKRVELTDFRNFPHVKKVATDARKAFMILANLVKEMDQRYMQLEAEGLKGIKYHNRRFPDNKWSYKLCVIDEFADLMLNKDFKKEIEDMVQRLNQLGRASGIHVILATQRPSVDVVTGIIKANMPARVGFACEANVDYRTIFDKIPNFNLIGNGDGAIKWHGNKELFVRFQSPINYDEEIYERIINKWGSKGNQLQIEEELDDKLYEEDTDEKFLLLKKVICETGETRIKQLREMTKLNQNKIQEYFQQLVEEGWLEKGNSRQSGYKLKLTDIEREIFLDSLTDNE